MPSFSLPDDLTIAYQEWGHGNTKRVVLSHGYMDNSNSFKILGPYLAERGYHAVAVDYIGHGHSDHLGAGGSYSMHGMHVIVLRHLTDTLKWEKCYIIGHSMGANIGVMFAACYPKRVEKIVLIEGIGPMVKPASSAPNYLRGAIDTEIVIKKKTGGRSKWYPSFGEAIEARLQAVKHYPGEQEHIISRAAVAAIVARYPSQYLSPFQYLIHYP
jgi:pimeloyl-ACP methyl ester carboxylesterase